MVKERATRLYELASTSKPTQARISTSHIVVRTCVQVPSAEDENPVPHGDRAVADACQRKLPRVWNPTPTVAGWEVDDPEIPKHGLQTSHPDDDTKKGGGGWK